MADRALLERVRALMPQDAPVWLVGGAVRDQLRGKPIHDLDFTLTGDVQKAARRLANRLGAAYFPLDVEHGAARVVLIHDDGRREVIDFLALRGAGLEDDLRARDFTINAIALPLHGNQQIIDPLGGAADLRSGVLRACSPTALSDDPVRIMRGVRQAAAFGLRIPPETLAQMRAAVPGLAEVSIERARDELFKTLDGAQPVTALRILDSLGVLGRILPEVEPMRGLAQSAPHIYPVWEHSLQAVARLSEVMGLLAAGYEEQRAGANFTAGLLTLRLGRYREQIRRHFEASLNTERSARSLLMLAALLHDAGKPATLLVEADGRRRFFDHDNIGARLVEERASALRLSNGEVAYLGTVVRAHMRPFLLGQAGTQPSRRAIYRFFRDTGRFGVDVCLLYLADTLAVYGPELPQQTWLDVLDVVRALLEAYWEKPEEAVSPPQLLNGRELMHALGVESGPEVGRLLSAIAEAQAAGEVPDSAAALALADSLHRANSADDEAQG